MALKGLPIIKCLNCGKTTLLDEYELNGCTCGSRDRGVDYRSYKVRAHLSELKGIQVFTGIYHKAGHLHYNKDRRYALISNITCGTDETFTNHAYIDNISPNSLEILKSLKPGTHIQFKARVHKYNKYSERWGFDRMHHVIELV